MKSSTTPNCKSGASTGLEVGSETSMNLYGMGGSSFSSKRGGGQVE